jgi:hypothetical protein
VAPRRPRRCSRHAAWLSARQKSCCGESACKREKDDTPRTACGSSSKRPLSSRDSSPRFTRPLGRCRHPETILRPRPPRSLDDQRHAKTGFRRGRRNMRDVLRNPAALLRVSTTGGTRRRCSPTRAAYTTSRCAPGAATGVPGELVAGARPRRGGAAATSRARVRRRPPATRPSPATKRSGTHRRLNIVRHVLGRQRRPQPAVRTRMMKSAHDRPVHV